MRIEAQISTKMHTFNDPKQATKLREALHKFEGQNKEKLKCFTAEELENSENFNKLQRDILERQTMSDIATLVPVDDSKTTFPDFTPLEALGERAKVVDEHYAKQNEQNKKFDNPRNHIWRKYYDRKYSYYKKGLTNLEREIVYENEIRALNGRQPTVCAYDPILQEKFGSQNDNFMNDMKYNQKIRNQIKDSVNQLFAENNIVIPNDVELQFVVDPYDQKIYALGVEDELADKIEMALNRGNNGKNLYSHIEYCNPAKFGLKSSEQYFVSDPWKRSTFLFVKDTTGLDIRELENKNGKFYTPDGEDLWDAVTRGYHSNEKYYDESILQGYYKHYQSISKSGWDTGLDSNRVIGYKNGDLYDIGTEYGYGEGQRAWQKDIIKQAEQHHQEYRKQREKTLKEEESNPTALEAFYAKYGVPEEIETESQYSYYDKDGKIHTNFFDNEMIKKIDTLNDMLDRYMQMANQMGVPAKARPHVNYRL